MRYFRLYRDRDASRKGLRLHRIESQPEIDLPWRAGQAFAEAPSQPIVCRLQDRPGATLPDAFLADRIPLFSPRLVKGLLDAGVSTLATYAAELRTSGGELLATDFHAVNIVDRVTCADLEASIRHPLSDYPMIEFSRLVIDADAARGCRLFRLAENPSFILLDETVKRALDALPLVNVKALSLDDPAAY